MGGSKSSVKGMENNHPIKKGGEGLRRIDKISVSHTVPVSLSLRKLRRDAHLFTPMGLDTCQPLHPGS